MREDIELQPYAEWLGYKTLAPDASGRLRFKLGDKMIHSGGRGWSDKVIETDRPKWICLTLPEGEGFIETHYSNLKDALDQEVIVT